MINLALKTKETLTANLANKKILSFALGNLLLITASKIQVGILPVPFTLQTYALMLIGLMYTPKMAVSIVGAYILEGMVGLPVFAGSLSGLAYILGNTGGYILGFLPCVAIISYLNQKHMFKNTFGRVFALILGLSSIYILGVSWLSNFIGLEKAVQYGFLPFIAPALLKIAMAFASFEGTNLVKQKLIKK